MLRKLRNIFIAGILVILPLVATTYIIWYLFKIIDYYTSPVVRVIFDRDLPGLGFLLTLAIIFLVGLLATNIIGKKIIQLGELLLLKIPFFRNIYMSIKQVLEGMFAQSNQDFKQVIMFEYPRRGLYQIGFITSKTTDFFSEKVNKEMYNVFLPTTPNPTSGMFIMVPRDEVYILDITVEEALKLIISGGFLDLDDIPQNKLKG